MEKVIFQPYPEYRGRKADKRRIKNRDKKKKKLDREVPNCGCTFRELSNNTNI